MPGLFPSLTDLALGSVKSAGQSALQSLALKQASQLANGEDQAEEVNAALAETASHCWKQLPQNVTRTGFSSKRFYWRSWTSLPKLRAVGEREKICMILAVYAVAGVVPSSARFRINPNATYRTFPIFGPKKIAADHSLTRDNLATVLKRKPILSYSNLGVSSAFSSIALDLLSVLNIWSNTLNSKGEDSYEAHYKDRLFLIAETYEFIELLSTMNIDYYTLGLFASRIYSWFLLVTVKASIKDGQEAEAEPKYDILGNGDVKNMFKDLLKEGYKSLERLVIEFCTRAFVCKLDELVNLFEAVILSSEQFLTSRDILASSSKKQDICNGKSMEYRPRLLHGAPDEEQRLIQETQFAIKAKITNSKNYVDLCQAIFSISGALKINDTRIRASDAQKYLLCVKKISEGDEDIAVGVKEHILSILKKECSTGLIGVKASISFRKTFMKYMRDHSGLYEEMANLLLKQLLLLSMNNLLIFYRDYMQEFGDSQLAYIGKSCSELVDNIDKVADEVCERMKTISEGYKSKLTKKFKDEISGNFRSEIYGLMKHSGELKVAIGSCAEEIRSQIDLYKEHGIQISTIRSAYDLADQQAKTKFLTILGVFDERKRFGNSVDSLELGVEQEEGLSPTNSQVKSFVQSESKNLKESMRAYYARVGDTFYEAFDNVFNNTELVFMATGENGKINKLVKEATEKNYTIKGYKNVARDVQLNMDDLDLDSKMTPEQFYEVIDSENRRKINDAVSKAVGEDKSACIYAECQERATAWWESFHSCRICWHGKFCNDHSTKSILLSDENPYVCRNCQEGIRAQNYSEIYEKRHSAGLSDHRLRSAEEYAKYKKAKDEF
ncbi:hypothetical protein ACGP04_07525 [Piscirickettsia salmonis]|uniref:hypothetical protein n=1 Tax=Piscirickettsia salmonis TaxID=1238 RepID=UPI000F078405|nr:hypothetical protein DA717_06255 [Piscirickettsiaceae bacterium NZ-RLO2]